MSPPAAASSKTVKQAIEGSGAFFFLSPEVCVAKQYVTSVHIILGNPTESNAIKKLTRCERKMKNKKKSVPR
jgi:anthranilate phosphoribosyltransferase